MVLKRDLLMLQLNSYRNDRYARWFNSSHESTNTQRIICCIALFILLVNDIHVFAKILIAGLLQLPVIWRLLRAKYKKPLVFTKRATRIYVSMILVSLLIILGLTIWIGGILTIADAIIAISIVSPLVLLISNIILRPVESHINKKYYNEAASILASMPSLKIIGITGSYGKTSTKHYLHRILAEQYDVAMTPGSYNTTLGVIRTIREYLKPYNEIFIVEMGAKQPGDIKEICDLVHPSIGIVTAVGEQHLESFKTIENIQRTKFELIDSLPENGFAVINDDFEYISNREVTSVETVRYAVRNTSSAQCIISKIETNQWGTDFEINFKGNAYSFHTRLIGECNISNLAAAIIVALHLKMDYAKIAYAVEKIEQVEHRLNLKRTPGGVTIIDDAFNSNPTGSAMALDVLSSFKTGKRIIVTPGMIELGEQQFNLNYNFGKKFSTCVDIAIIVGNYNKEPIGKGAMEGGMDESKIIFASTFADAQNHLSQILKPGDTILYENDLPDTFK